MGCRCRCPRRSTRSSSRGRSAISGPGNERPGGRPGLSQPHRRPRGAGRQPQRRGGGLAFLLWTAALSRLTPTRVAVYVSLNPVVAALLGVWLLGERRSVPFAIGFAAVVAGVALVNWPSGT
ncbi:MAG TPA: DMT family transporter [Actinomycetota bacterium]|nr:DMT family transporter [Actinomycetota bacterium]